MPLKRVRPEPRPGTRRATRKGYQVRMKILAAALLAALGLSAGPAFAQSQEATVSVSATVPEVCRFITTTAQLTLSHDGTFIDPLTTADATGTTSLQYFCGVGVVVEFSTPELTDWAPGKAGTPTLTRVGGTETMLAAVTINPLGDAPVGQGYDVPLQVAVTGTLGQPEFSTVPAGNYVGSQVFQIRGKMQ